jgi:hypothetical protein
MQLMYRHAFDRYCNSQHRSLMGYPVSSFIKPSNDQIARAQALDEYQDATPYQDERDIDRPMLTLMHVRSTVVPITNLSILV